MERYVGFYIEEPVGNNVFSYDERTNKKIFVPKLIEGTLDDGSKFNFFRPAIEQESCHIEYFFKNHKKEVGPAIDVANINQTFFIWPIKYKEALTKIHFATEEIYNMAMENLKGE